MNLKLTSTFERLNVTRQEAKRLGGAALIGVVISPVMGEVSVGRAIWSAAATGVIGASLVISEARGADRTARSISPEPLSELKGAAWHPLVLGDQLLDSTEDFDPAHEDIRDQHMVDSLAKNSRS